MKISLPLLLASATLALAACESAPAPAPAPAPSTPAAPSAPSPSPEIPKNLGPIVGGYGDAANTDPEVLAAARFAVEAESARSTGKVTLLAVEQAEVQVVAGLNYRMTLRVQSGGTTKLARVVVYRNLQQQNSLTSWEEVTL